MRSRSGNGSGAGRRTREARLGGGKGHGPLGPLETTVLRAVLACARDEAYAIPIRAEIVQRTGREVSRGAVYTTLGRLLEKGLLESRMSQPMAVRGGRSRRCYTVTAVGMAALHSTEASLVDAWGPLRPAEER